jgi:myo-inositol-1(or 4)-monophosphatase
MTMARMLGLLGADTARQVRQLVHEVPHGQLDTKSSTIDLVTLGDQSAEATMVEALTLLRPEDGIIGEEGADRPSKSGLLWLIDPIDGTTNYVYNFPAWTTSVAVAQLSTDGTLGPTIAGCVVDVSHGDVYLAGAGLGATKNGIPIRVRSTPSLEQALVATGFAYQRERRHEQATTVARVLDGVRDIRRAGSAALDCCWVAAGVLDAYYENHVRSWDVAAGMLIASEAGAIVRDFADADPHADTLLTWACSPTVADEFASLIGNR